MSLFLRRLVFFPGMLLSLSPMARSNLNPIDSDRLYPSRRAARASSQRWPKAENATLLCKSKLWASTATKLESYASGATIEISRGVSNIESTSQGNWASIRSRNSSDPCIHAKSNKTTVPVDLEGKMTALSSTNQASSLWRGVDCAHSSLIGLCGIWIGAKFSLQILLEAAKDTIGCLGLADFLAASTMRSSLTARWRDPIFLIPNKAWEKLRGLFAIFSSVILSTFCWAELSALSLELALIFDTTSFTFNEIAARTSSKSTWSPVDFISFFRISRWSSSVAKLTLFDPSSIFRARSWASAASLARLYIPR